MTSRDTQKEVMDFLDSLDTLNVSSQPTSQPSKLTQPPKFVPFNRSATAGSSTPGTSRNPSATPLKQPSNPQTTPNTNNPSNPNLKFTPNSSPSSSPQINQNYPFKSANIQPPSTIPALAKQTSTSSFKKFTPEGTGSVSQSKYQPVNLPPNAEQTFPPPPSTTSYASPPSTNYPPSSNNFAPPPVNNYSSAHSTHPPLFPNETPPPGSNVNTVPNSSFAPPVNPTQTSGFAPPPVFSVHNNLPHQKQKSPTQKAKRTGYVPSFQPLPPGANMPEPIAQEPIINNENRADDGGWSWNSVWNTASKGLENAKQLAGTAAQVVGSSETVKGLVPEIQKLSKLVAPPIEGTPAKFPGKVGIYLGASLMDTKLRHQCLIHCKQSATEMWLERRAPYHNTTPLCDDVDVIFIEDPNPILATSLQQAVSLAEVTLEKLQNQANTDYSSNRKALFVIQPFTTSIESMITDTETHVSYYCSLVCDSEKGLVTARCISQSISQASDEGWKTQQSVRVLGTAIVDVLEEFMISVLKQ
ncbi:hypothetical protein BC833DRAFT_622102 [Globomyces pollinis-pini]|nr:hypothetical protein BC833DRAFT_622102 [Globomyces pollinis-pini]